ncbi:MerR family transcriptional regulator [Nocardia sp. NPDC058518]|uniref:DNA polymerase III subunit beta family protein n=1 Tax=Nocardia sp. NPDC058518 TaxID=3346534 RepID=UPI003659BA0D
MPDTELITIGAFARACGLSASALRFYADAGILVPAVVDEVTGYRYYAPEQTDTARLIRHLRAIDMPLPAVAAVLADPADTAGLVDEHLAAMDRRSAEIRTAATAARAALRVGRALPSNPDPACRTDPGHAPRRGDDPASDAVWVSGPALAAAVDQVATATLTDPTMRVLDTILFEADAQELTLTATDRYRLATRTLRTTCRAALPWTATIAADDLRSTVSWLRRQYSVAVVATASGIEFATAAEVSGGAGRTAARGRGERPGERDLEAHSGRVDGDVGHGASGVELGPNAGPGRRHCRRSTEDFPDYREMLAALPPVSTRVVLARADLLHSLENAGSSTVVLHVSPPNAVSITADGTTARPDTDAGTADRPANAEPSTHEADHSGVTRGSFAAEITGPAMTVHFAVTTLYPAIAGAVGADVMLDLIAADMPVLIRSADDGGLSTLAMPCKPEPTEETSR